MKDDTKSQSFNEGLNHGLSSAEDSESASQASLLQRRPLHSPDISGKNKDSYVPHRILHAKNRAEQLSEPIEQMRDVRIERELAAGCLAKPLPWLIALLVLMLFDGLLLGPIISNAIHSFKSQTLIFLVGLGVSLIIVAGGWGIGWAIRSYVPGGQGKLLAALISAITGAGIGYMIGLAGDGTKEGILIRTALTSLSMLAAAVFHFLHSESSEAWGAVAVARKQENELIAKRDSYLQEIDEYQEAAIAEHETFHRNEADRREGLLAGKDGRRRWIRPDFTKLTVMLFACVFMACTGPLNAEERSTTVLVVDITDETNRETLASRVLENAPLGYGQAVEVYLLGCSGLTLAYRNQVKPINVPKHKQHLKAVKEGMAKALKEEVAGSADTACSPIATSLTLLSMEMKVRQKNGEYLSLVVGSDFVANREQTEVKGQPFAGMEVVVILSNATGRNLKQREKALKLIERLFAGANLTISN